MRNGVGNADCDVRDLFRLFHRLNRINAAFSVNPTLYDIGTGHHCNVRPVRAVTATRNLHVAAGELDDARRRLRIPSISVECDLHGVLAVSDVYTGHHHPHTNRASAHSIPIGAHTKPANRPRTAPTPMQLPV